MALYSVYQYIKYNIFEFLVQLHHILHKCFRVKKPWKLFIYVKIHCHEKKIVSNRIKLLNLFYYGFVKIVKKIA